MKKINRFFIWFMLNVALPASPLAIKFAINFFGNEQMGEIVVLDGGELLYYSLFLSIIMINMLNGKEMLIENILKVVLVIICTINLIILMLFYLKLNNDYCLTYSIIMAILIPILNSIYMYRTIDSERR